MTWFPWWAFWTLLALSLGGLAFTIYAAVRLGAREDREADAELRTEVERLDRQYALPAREPVR